MQQQLEGAVEHLAFLDSGVPGLDRRRQALALPGYCASFRASREVRGCCNQFQVGLGGLIHQLSCQPRGVVLVFIDGEQSKTPAMKLRNDEGCTATER
jgi:hypothetical protein